MPNACDAYLIDEFGAALAIAGVGVCFLFWRAGDHFSDVEYREPPASGCDSGRA